MLHFLKADGKIGIVAIVNIDEFVRTKKEMGAIVLVVMLNIFVHPIDGSEMDMPLSLLLLPLFMAKGSFETLALLLQFGANGFVGRSFMEGGRDQQQAVAA